MSTTPAHLSIVRYYAVSALQLTLHALGVTPGRSLAGSHAKSLTPAWSEVLIHYVVAPLRGVESHVRSRWARCSFIGLYACVAVGAIVVLT